jgi:hypothetical protein
MIGLAQGLSPILAVAMVSAVMWYLRSQQSARTKSRTRQLNEAAAFLELHERSLGRFAGRSGTFV